jgi:diguanylate cyclase (GGDEF)-like protein
LLDIAPLADVTCWAVADFYAPHSHAQLICEAIPTCLATGRWRGESTLIDGNGDEIPVSQVLVAHRGALDGATAISSISWNMREQKEMERQLLHKATHDDLTGLPNRALLVDRLNKALHSAERHRRCVGLLFIDLDGFKAINDELGHEAGNAVLREFSRRLRGSVRAEDTVARYGGDEFVLLAPSVNGEQGARRVMGKVRAALSDPFDLGARSIRVGASVGIAVYPNDAGDPQALLRRADALMYSAKTSPNLRDVASSGISRPAHGSVRWMSCDVRFRGVA